LALSGEERRYLSWQFGLAGVEQVLAALGERDEWEEVNFFLNPSGLLCDRTPLEVLRAGERANL